MKINNHGLLVFWNKKSSNLGDFVQTLAARQFLPSVNAYCDREDLKGYSGKTVNLIMNGWFMYNTHNFPPSDFINPLYTSFHINSDVYEVMTSPVCLDHFKKYEPIGCRDIATRNLLLSKNIEAYFSGCLTLTLGKTYKRDYITDDIYLVDPLLNHYHPTDLLLNPRKLAGCLLRKRFYQIRNRKKLMTESFSKDILRNAKTLTQIATVNSIEDGLSVTDQYLKKLCHAKLVITSRIHCALPCLAMGTPVIFLNGEVDNNTYYTCRFDGLLELLNVINIDKKGHITRNFESKGKISSHNIVPNKSLHLPLVNELMRVCENIDN